MVGGLGARLFGGAAVLTGSLLMLISLSLCPFFSLSLLLLSLSLCSEEQLSKQRHYDFGLRNILSVLRTGGVNLRVELLKDSSQDRSHLEEMLMMRTLRDMNLSKLVADDVDLFLSLLKDLFPNQKDPEKRRYDAEEEAMRTVIEEKKLVHHDTWVNKIVQLYETSLVRHGLMMVRPHNEKKKSRRLLCIQLTDWLTFPFSSLVSFVFSLSLSLCPSVGGSRRKWQIECYSRVNRFSDFDS